MISQIITLGYGSSGAPKWVITLGYSSAEVNVPTQADIGWTAANRRLEWTAANRRLEWTAT